MRVRVLENIDMSCCYFSEGGSFDIQNMPKYHDYLRLVSLMKLNKVVIHAVTVRLVSNKVHSGLVVRVAGDVLGQSECLELLRDSSHHSGVSGALRLADPD